VTKERKGTTSQDSL